MSFPRTVRQVPVSISRTTHIYRARPQLGINLHCVHSQNPTGARDSAVSDLPSSSSATPLVAAFSSVPAPTSVYAALVPSAHIVAAFAIDVSHSAFRPFRTRDGKSSEHFRRKRQFAKVMHPGQDLLYCGELQ